MAGLLATTTAQAQAPVITTLTPGRNALGVARTTAVQVGFAQPLASSGATLGALHVYSQQAGGQKAGTATASGATLTFTPATAFQPGETVMATVTTAVQSTGGQHLAVPQVVQFTTATAPSAGTFYNGFDIAYASTALVTGDVNGDGKPDLLAADTSYGTTAGTTVRVYLNTGTGSFALASTVLVNPGSAGTRTMVLGDVDGDADLDLLAVNETTNTVSVRLNGGNGTFGGGQEVAVGQAPHDLALGDVDGDGDLDLATANGGSAAGLSVRLNTGTGSFGSGGDYATTPYSEGSLALGDVDGDGDLDAVLGNATIRLVDVVLNSGQGTFSAGAAQSVVVADEVLGIALGDLDGDGDLDLVSSGGQYTSVRFNTGAGTFGGTQQLDVLGVSNSTKSLVLGDINGDGDLDLLLAPAGDNSAIVFSNNGQGSFQATQRALLGGSGTDQLLLSDVNGDGTLDLVATAGPTIGVRLNQQELPPTLQSVAPASALPGASVTLTGTYLTSTTGVTFGGVAAQFLLLSATQVIATVPSGVGAAPIVVTTPSGASNSLSFTILTPLVVTTLMPGRNALGVARTTAVQVGFSLPVASSETLHVYSQRAGGQKAGTTTASGATLTFTPATAFQPGETVFATVTPAGGATPARGATPPPLTLPQVYQFTTATAPASGLLSGGTSVATMPGSQEPMLGDLDGDGDLDIVVATNTGVSVRRNDGTGTYSGSQELPLGTIRQAILGDVDGDGDLDLLAVGQGVVVQVLKNDGTGTFTSAQQLRQSLTPYSLALGDMDGNGYLDLVVADITGNLTIFSNQQGTFSTFGSSVQTGSPYSRHIVLGDVDGDGDLDVAIFWYYGRASIYKYANGSLTLGQQLDGTVGGGGYVDDVTLGDVDGDGDLDLLTASYTSSRVSVRRNDGTGTFTGTQEVDFAARGCSNLALGDIDGDGDLDLVVTDVNTATIGVRRNDGAGTFTGTQEAATDGASPGGLALGDIDGDGDLDVAVTFNGGATVRFLLNQNTAPLSALVGSAAGAAATWQAAPNPFTTFVGIDFSLARAESYSLAVYDGLGRLVERLADGQAPAGVVRHLEWPTATYPAGLYLVRLRTASGAQQNLKISKD